ncbi:substrate-binding domain-containing protein [Pelomonas sp. KK5]|uniref:sugar ABC transporter substrate-binding protein n=1 Tax=Pelomonas sp. KK5 TaxID=1855730 RepID=UPI001E504B68|nr:substrate-binding domain-containing protein [Pelomonas sp. KK5]
MKHPLRTLTLGTASAALAALFLCSPAAAQGTSKQIYLVSHGSESDPFWIEWNRGVKAACEKVRARCNVSFNANNVAGQKEAINAAIAGKADAIVTTSAEPKLWNTEVAAAKKAGIPVIFFNSDDPASGRYAYVGANLQEAGVIWARYLVDNKLVKAGDSVFLPVEAAGATYQILETRGIASVFDPLGIKHQVLEVGSDPASLIARMTEYLTAHRDVKAIIGLGDLVTAHARTALKNVGAKPGQIPVVGWGNTRETADAVVAGYVQAGLWQFPYDQGYLPVIMADNLAKPQGKGYDVVTLAVYDKSTVQDILKGMAGAKK